MFNITKLSEQCARQNHRKRANWARCHSHTVKRNVTICDGNKVTIMSRSQPSMPNPFTDDPYGSMEQSTNVGLKLSSSAEHRKNRRREPSSDRSRDDARNSIWLEIWRKEGNVLTHLSVWLECMVTLSQLPGNSIWLRNLEGLKEMLYLMTHLVHFIYGYIESITRNSIWLEIWKEWRKCFIYRHTQFILFMVILSQLLGTPSG